MVFYWMGNPVGQTRTVAISAETKLGPLGIYVFNYNTSFFSGSYF